MLQVNNVSLRFGKRTLFENVNSVKAIARHEKLLNLDDIFTISKRVLKTNGRLAMVHRTERLTQILDTASKYERISVLKQDHYQYDDVRVLDVVIMGNDKLYKIMKEKEELYSHTEFTEEDGYRLADLEAEFLEMDGWNAENDAAILLNNLGVKDEFYDKKMSEIPVKLRVKVLLASALFGNPDILLLDEPTNSLDLDAINWLEEFLINFPNTVIVVSHDRYFLNKVCTHIVDIDFGKMKMYIGNYDFWYQSSELALKQMKESNKKKEEKIKLYKKIYDCLKEHGQFINCDKIALTQEIEDEQLYELEHNIENHKHIDTPLTVEHEIEVLKRVGFEDITSSNVDKDDYTLIKARKIKRF